MKYTQYCLNDKKYIIVEVLIGKLTLIYIENMLNLIKKQMRQI